MTDTDLTPTTALESDPSEPPADPNRFTMYTTSWCGFCGRLKRGLQSAGIAYDEVNIEEVDGAAEIVTARNGGNRTVPTLLFSDGSSLTNPSVAEVEGAVGPHRVNQAFTATTPSALPALIADVLGTPASDHPTRVALDGPTAAGPDELAEAVAGELRSRGRPATVITASSYWRDASLRLEYGRTDVDSYAHGWLDAPALTREVLAPLGPDGSGQFLPALRDPATNRSARVPYRAAAADEIVIIAGELLLGHGLAFDATVHLALSPAVRARRTSPAMAWTLPAYERYDRDVDPTATADVVVRWNDANRPAISVRANTVR